MANQLRDKNKDTLRRETAEHLTKFSNTEHAPIGEENESQNIPSDINELRVKKDQNLLDLQNLTNMLKSRISQDRDDIEDADDDLERATIQQFAE